MADTATGLGSGPTTIEAQRTPAERPARAPLVTKRTVVGIAIFLGVLVFFLTQTRLALSLLKLDTADRAQTARGRLGFAQVLDPEAYPPALRWVAYGVNLWDGNALGMFFAMLLAGAAAGFASPAARLRRLLERRGAMGAGVGGVMGMPLLMCSACSAPVSLGFYRTGATVETSLGVIIGSALFNPIALVAMFAVLPAQMGLSRVAFGLIALFALVPLIARFDRRRRDLLDVVACDLSAVQTLDTGMVSPETGESWPSAITRGIGDWVRNSVDVAWRLGPAMLAATFAVGVLFTLAPPQTFSDRIGSGLFAIVVAAAVGTLLQTPALFEIPLVLGLLFLGLEPGAATALLVTAPSAGVITLGVTRSELGWRTPLLLMAGTLVGGVVAGMVVSAL
ncbi:MAG: permease [Actinomycetota bacterium]|jgi:uncharacterized membrane protein YraQ (UPF0718 family)|nr:permease [Actinomycetota bacterium]